MAHIDSNDRIASICFMPTCSRCGKIIHGLIDYGRGPEFGEYYIVPRQCPHCHAIFNLIKQPANGHFPFVGYDGGIIKNMGAQKDDTESNSE